MVDVEKTRVGKFLGAMQSEAETTLTLQATDGLVWKLTIPIERRGEIVDALQQTISRGQSAPYLTLTPLSGQPVLNPEMKGVLLKTKEAGTIALALPGDSVQKLKAILAELESIMSPEDRQ